MALATCEVHDLGTWEQWGWGGPHPYSEQVRSCGGSAQGCSYLAASTTRLAQLPTLPHPLPSTRPLCPTSHTPGCWYHTPGCWYHTSGGDTEAKEAVSTMASGWATPSSSFFGLGRRGEGRVTRSEGALGWGLADGGMQCRCRGQPGWRGPRRWVRGLSGAYSDGVRG